MVRQKYPHNLLLRIVIFILLCLSIIAQLTFLSFSLSFSFPFSFCLLLACPPGTFKSSQGEGLCLQCPPNSRSTSEAATICVCRNGYYRGDTDLPDMPCTSKCSSHCFLLQLSH